MKFRESVEIEDSKPVIEIESQGKIWDLHNAAEFIGFIFIVKENKLTLNFKYYINYEKSKAVDCQIHLLEVESLAITPRDFEVPFSEDDCLSEIFFDKKQQIISFAFWGGMKIVVKCKEFVFVPPSEK